MTVDPIEKPDKTNDSKRDPASIFGIKLKKTVIKKPVIDRKKNLTVQTSIDLTRSHNLARKKSVTDMI